MEPSPLPVLKDSSSEGLAPDAPPRPAAEGMEELDRVYSGLSGAVFSKPTRNRGPSVLLPVWGENTGGNRFHTKAIESSECVRGRPARSSAISVSEAPRASAQEDATLLVEWALNLNGQGTPCAW